MQSATDADPGDSAPTKPIGIRPATEPSTSESAVVRSSSSTAVAWGATTLLAAVGLQAAFVHAPARMKLLLLTAWGFAAAIAFISCWWADWLAVRLSRTSVAMWVVAIVLAGQLVSLELSYQEFLNAQAKRETAGLNPIMIAAIRNAPEHPTTPEEKQGLDRMRDALSRLDQPVSVRFPRSRFLQWRIHAQCNWNWPLPLVWWLGETIVAMIVSATIVFRNLAPRSHVP